MYGKTTQSTTPTPTNPVAIKDINNPKITVTMIVIVKVLIFNAH